MKRTGPRLWRALLKRETGRSLAAAVFIVAAAAVVFANRSVHDAAAAGPFIRLRFDMAVLLLATVVLVLRVATRAEADRTAAWLEPVLVVGGSPARYGLALTASAWCSSLVVYTTAASAFAFAMAARAGSVELLRTLPRTIGTGALLLGAFAVHAGCVGMLLRRSVPAISVVAAVVIVPYALMTRTLLRGGPVDWWLYALTHVVPPVALPAGAADVLPLLGQVAAGAGLLAGISHRFAGRRP